MKHTVLVPAWRRPDFLHACLTRLEAAARPGVAVVVSLDRDYDPACLDVITSFYQRLPAVHLRVTPVHNYRGNSCNVLSGLRDCLHLGGDFFHVVEEDVLVARGYFPFHEAMHRAAPQVFAVSACRNQNRDGPGERAAYLDASYQSLGVSFRRPVAESLVMHDGPFYYDDMIRYCRRTFPGSAIPPGHAEQDGLVNRIREQAGGRTLYTSRPRAFHAGFHGYNRPGTALTGGSVPERAQRILTMSSAEMNELAGQLKDHHVIDLDEELSLTPEQDALRPQRA